MGNVICASIGASLMVLLGAVPAHAAPYTGPCLFDTLRLLRAGELPVLLGHGAPTVMITRQGGAWVVREYGVDEAKAKVERERALAAGGSWMPEHLDSCCRKPGKPLLRRSSLPELEQELLAGFWKFVSYLGDAEHERFNVSLQAAGPNPERVTEALRQAGIEEPAQAIMRARKAPVVVARRLQQEQARTLARALAQAGARLRIEVSLTLYEVVLERAGRTPARVIEAAAEQAERPPAEIRAALQRLPAVIGKDLAGWRARQLAEWLSQDFEGAQAQARPMSAPRRLLLRGM